ncbi:calcium-binding protein [Halobacterium salinarum]|uniref:calcium-binding protein n=1 Tax=Halobacterium salinarum TaxID=2242 RepID=UPI002553A182|nr:calcium-binding protein [Halobacterium salinarum]MDL0126654.1 calcium-binding protein [Halobacterium salinarum]
MTRIDRDEEREKRIKMDIVVDAYNRHERAIGWYTYLEDTIRFPFEAQCIEEREVSPLEEGEDVRVNGMSSVEASQSEMFVTVDWMGRELGVPLAQVEPIKVDGETEEAVADWHYWAGRGYEF